MARLFDEVNDDIQIADSADLTLPNSDWSIGSWLKFTDNTGNVFQYFWSWGAFSVNPSFNIFMNEAGASDAGKIKFQINGPLGAFSTTTANDIFNLHGTNWIHVIFQRSGTTGTLYINNVDEASEASITLGVVNVATAFFLGSRSDSNADRFYGGRMADFFKVDRALNSAERGALAARVNIMSVVPDADVLLRMEGLNSPEPDWSGGKNNGAVTGAVLANNPPVIPYSRRFWAAGGPLIEAVVAGVSQFPEMDRMARRFLHSPALRM